VKLKKLFDKLFEGKTLGETKIPLWCAVTNITKNRLEFLSSEHNPDMPIAEAVRASSCIPMIFKSVLYNGDIYVDGGMFADFPVDIFEIDSSCCRVGTPKGSNDQTLGCMIEGNRAYLSAKQNMWILDWIDALVDTWVDVGIKKSIDNAPKHVAIANATGLGINTLDFNLSKDTKISLIAEGYSAASKAMKDIGIGGLKIGKIGK
jgi:NTE family protein